MTMTPQNDNARGQAGEVGKAESSACNHTKIGRVLVALEQPSGLNRFDAERLGDHCLNSTVAQLREDGFDIRDEWETIPTRYTPRGVRVKRYRCLGRTEGA